MTRIAEHEMTGKALQDVAALMTTAARTAPKTRGKDDLFTLAVTGRDIEKLAVRMDETGKETGEHFFERDAENIRKSPVLILLGARISPARLPKCGMCGYADCDEKDLHPDSPCVFNTIDLGIATGSAVSVAADHRVDNRVMYTVGQAAIDLGYLPQEYRIVIGIPLSVTTKNIFFDRK
ncbi:MAG: ferredoxin [Chlorobi bacterium]|nr:ferredoxin [Chlorobiota bacterium]